MAFAGAKGVQYVSKIALFLNAIPLLMLLVVFFQTSGGIGNYQVAPAQQNSFRRIHHDDRDRDRILRDGGRGGRGFRHERAQRRRRASGAGWWASRWPCWWPADCRCCRWPALTAADLTQSWDYGEVVQAIGGPIASAMLFLFAIASIPPTCFCAFIAGNSFNTMIPGVPRVSSTMAAAAVGVVLAVTGVAANLIGFFTIVGASFGPICGAMVADYLLSGQEVERAA